MRTTRSIPAKDADFNVAQDTIINISYENRVAWGLDSDWLDAVSAKGNLWDSAYMAYLPEATRTPLITFEKNEARKVYEKDLRLLVKSLQSNPKVTADDLRSMGIVAPSSSRTPVPAPTTYPEFSTDSSTIRRLAVHFRNAGSDSSGKPKGVHGAEIRWAILDAAPVSVADLIHSSFDTRTPFTLEFDEPERGKTVWLCLRWENTRGEKGPWSEIESAIVP
ncbi:MAG: hypothetical protein LBU62_04705 [Bacteroidales bacterium]|jgi:hypothetical protein|nr:hypothetical protein [Bacteroidales bacterium]